MFAFYLPYHNQRFTKIGHFTSNISEKFITLMDHLTSINGRGEKARKHLVKKDTHVVARLQMKTLSLT